MNFSFCRQGHRKGCGLLVKMFMSVVIFMSLTIVTVQCTYGYTAVRGTVTVKSGKVRKTASANSQFVFGVIKDETVTIIGEEKGDDGKIWYKFKVLGSVGYIRSDFVKKSNIEVKSESTPDVKKEDTSSKTVNTLEKTQDAVSQAGTTGVLEK